MSLRALLLLPALLWMGVAQATYLALLDDGFNTDATPVELAATYPDWTALTYGGGDIQAIAGRLLLTGVGAASSQQYFSTDIAAGELWITAWLGRYDDDSFYNVSLGLAWNRIVFHPGKDAIRVEGSGGFSNVSAGWVPAVGVAHRLDVHLFDDGLVAFTFTDGLSDLVTFSGQFNRGSAWSGGEVGVWRSGHTDGTGFLDRLVIREAVIPAPSVVWLLLAGALGLAASRPHHRF